MSDDSIYYHLDVEFKRLLQMLKPYLMQLVDEVTIDLCNGWIQRLSSCDSREKTTRNKYVFTLCQQLAKGNLDKPFLEPPPEHDLPAIADELDSESSTDSDRPFLCSKYQKAETLYNNNKSLISESTEFNFQDIDDYEEKRGSMDGISRSMKSEGYKSRYMETPTIKLTPSVYKSGSARTQTLYCCTDYQSRPKEVKFDDGELIPIATDQECQNRNENKPDNMNNKDLEFQLVTINEQYDSNDDTNIELIHIPNNEEYEDRFLNLIMRLREIKSQNVLLNRELDVLREESKKPMMTDRSEETEDETFAEPLVKIDTAVNTNRQFDRTIQELAEEKEKNNFLIGKIEGLQEQLHSYNDIRRQDIEDIIAKHKQELNKIKQDIRNECKAIEEQHIRQMKIDHETEIINLKSTYEQELRLLKKNHENQLSEMENLVQSKENKIREIENLVEFKENKIREIENIIELKENKIREIQNLVQMKENKILEIETLVQIKEKDIASLKTARSDTNQGMNLKTILDKILERPNESLGAESEKLKVHELEKRLTKTEKTKVKCMKLYENRIAQLEREKHLSEFTTQVQLARQRTSIFNEINDENQAELNSTLNALETKYKGIVANVQATAIQRRMQDQAALEAILQAACGLQPGLSSPTNYSLYHKNKVSQRNSRGYDTDLTELLRQCEKNGGISYESDPAGYSLDGCRLSEIIQKVYIPQRDTGDNPNKLH